MHKAYGFHISGMMSKMITVTALIMAMNCLGCSGFKRVTSLRMDDQTASSAAAAAGAKMTQIKTRIFSIPRYTGAYKFQISKASIIFCPANLRLDEISMGPPLLPIIPVFFIGEPEIKSDTQRKRIEDMHHSVVIGIDGRETQLELDFSALRLKLMNGAPVRVDTVTVLGREQSCTNNSYRLVWGQVENLLNKQVIVNDSWTFYGIFFDASTDDVDGLMIDLGPIKIEGKQVKLPPLEYRKRNNYYYVPLILPLSY